MKIKVLNPDGVHAREIKGLAALKEALPNEWYGYASLELVGENGGEIDLVICAEDRLIAVEIKDWNGKIEDLGPYWRTSGREQKSPVVTIAEKSKKLASKLKTFLAPEHQAPWVDHCVLLTGKSRRNDLSEDSKDKTFELEFFKRIGNKEVFRECFTHEAWCRTPIHDLKPKLDVFFAGPRVRPLSCSYNGYKANDDPCYTHPKRIYSEYFAEKEGAKGFKALLRRWDFHELGNVDATYLNKENRTTLALREENAIGYLRDAKPELVGRNVFLAPISNEGRESVTENFFELYDLPRDLSRLKESLRRYGDSLKDDNRISIARLLLHHLSELHELEVAHRDIGEHCIWISVPDKVSLSGFATSSFPEQKTVAQIRETIRGGGERIPEELLDLKSNNFRKDVFLLGSVVHQILFGTKPRLVDGVPTWHPPTNGKFDQFWGWFDRALELDPAKRFSNATSAFDEFQRCSKTSECLEFDEKDFREFEKSIPPMPRLPGDTVLRQDSGGLVFHSECGGGDACLNKVWPDAKFKPGAVAENFHLLSFLERIQRLQMADLECQQRVLDFGITSFGSYVVLKWEGGQCLEEFEGESFDDEAGLAFVRALVQAVADLHRCQIFHGDLKPGNILYALGEEGETTIRLIDLVDFAPAGTERRSSAYLPPEGEEATTPGCDGYALKKIVTDFVLPRMPGMSKALAERITAILGDMVDPDGGIPDVKGALDELANPFDADDESSSGSREELVISMGGIEREILMMPDDRGLPVTISRDRDDPESFVVRVTDSAHCLGLLVNAPRKAITKIWQQPATIMDLAQNLRWKASLLERPLRILRSQADDLTALNELLDELAIFSELDKLYRKEVQATREEETLASQVGHDFNEAGSDESDQAPSQTPETPLVDVPLDLFWEALLDAEARIVPVMAVTDEPVEIRSSGILVLPVGEPSAPFDPQDDEPVEVQTQDPAGEWRYFGNLDNRRSQNGRLAVVPKARGTFRPRTGTALRLENKASRASYLKRLAAVQRIVGRDSVCPELFDYFGGDGCLDSLPGRFAGKLDGLDAYGLNPVQRDALETALKCSPLAMIQGPPGTGKTGVISAAAHYIATNFPTAKILVVSQSHEAIDHATEQIVKRFRKQGDEPSLVRVGRRAAISDNLISFHSESLQGEYRERFRLSLTQRILPLGSRLGLSEAFAESLAVIRARLVPLLQQLGPEPSGEEAEIDPALRRHLENACRQLDPGFDFPDAAIASVCGLMEQRLIDRHGETDQQSVNALRKIIDLALEWVQILETPGKLDRFYVGSSQIVTGTCVGVGRWQLGLESEAFDCVIIDEAARCGPGDLAVASQVAHQVILVGDHKQLPPFLEKDVVNRVARDLPCPPCQVERSDFQRLFESPYAELAGRTLKTQYRMRQPIGRLVSECFYPETGGIEAGRKTSSECYDSLPERISRHVTWIDSEDGGEERVRTSFVNRSEIDRIMQVLEEIDRDEALIDGLINDAAAEGLPAAIGIIAAYKAQADAIEERVWQSSLTGKLRQTCKVGTVDSYQGKENPVVIFSAVRCNPHDEIGFTRSWERVNVSLSRARERLVIVGSWNFWESAGVKAPLGKVVNFLTVRLAESDEGYARIAEPL